MAKENIEKILVKIFKMKDYRFILKDREITLEEIFSPSGLLPAIAKRADNLCSLCLGYGLGAEFDKEEKSSLGTTVTLDESTPQALVVLMLFDVMEDIRIRSNSSKGIVLDELLYD